MNILYTYDFIFLIIFCISLAVFLFKRRKRLKVESKVFILYRSKAGLNVIDYIGSRFKKAFSIGSYIVISVGYILMAASIFLIIELLKTAIKMPFLLKAAKVPPIMPLIPYLPEIFKVDFLPPFYFTYWIIAIAIVAICHEMAHGVFARHYKIRIKSTGFGFLGPLLAAFVEPDEKQLQKKSIKEQLAVLSAGSFANLTVALFFIVVIIAFFAAFFAPSGMIFQSYVSSAVNISDITSVSNIPANNLSISEFSSIVKNIENFDLQLGIDNKEINLTRITANNKTYFASLTNLETQVESLKNSKVEEIMVFDDTPALRANLSGAIVRINSREIRDLSDIKNSLSKYSPYDTITIETVDEDYKTREYNITLAQDPKNKEKAFLGVAFVNTEAFKEGIISAVYRIIGKFRDFNTFYRPKFCTDLIIFIYNLLWWLIMINISLALFNMLPLGIFDGGRVFYLTMLAMTKSKENSLKIFKLVTMAFLAIFILLMLLWWIAI